MKRSVDFVGKRKIFIVISLVLIAFLLVSIFARGFNFGVDFAGGVEISVAVPDMEMTVGDVRELLTEVDPAFAGARIIRQRPLTDPEAEQRSRFSIVITSDDDTLDGDYLTDAVVQGLEGKGVTRDDILSISSISGYAAQEIRGFAWIAVILVVALVLMYITVRFRFSFGLGAIFALVHDVVIVMGFYSLFGMEFNAPVVAALLTLLGYSLNDTIVVFDRVRENLKKMRGQTIENIVNRSINEVIVRSLNTSITTFSVVLMLFIFSGEVLRPFAFGMLVGVIVGTYSSLYIAAPVVINWMKLRESRIQAKPATKS
jgi:preprotein translocase subunit SecF